MSPSFNTYGVFFFIVFLYGSIIAYYNKSDFQTMISTRALPLTAFKKLFTFVVVYVLLMYPLFRIAQASIYPGTVVTLYAEIRPDEASTDGSEFTFTSTLDGTVMNAYHQIHSGPDVNTVVPGADPSLVPEGEEIVPVVFLGGNGGSGWSNARWGHDFVQRYLEGDTKYFDVYSFSYRGYEPNEKHGISENKVVADSIDFVNYVMDKVRARGRGAHYSVRQSHERAF